MIETKRVLAVIPVRGGSKGIPRKNARLMNGKPLVSYSIETCLKSKYIDCVYVSTDDEELRELAFRYGAKVMERSPELAGDAVGLDVVIVKTTPLIEQREGVRFDYVVSVQATSPLIRSSSIDAGIRMIFESGSDTVVSVINDNHLSWKFVEGIAKPNYEQRLNRQLLPAHLKETGAYFVSSREILETGTRFGNKVDLVEVTKEEAIDINDRFDFWLAEKALSKRRICLHVIGNHKDGLGHVYRQLTLADRITEHEVYFLVNDKADLAIEQIRARHYPLRIVPQGTELSAIFEDDPHIVINDILNTEADFIQRLKDAGKRTINFEDLGSGALICDVLFNSMFESVNLERRRHYKGIEYCCLRDEFFSISPIRFKDSVENILILFGGTDPFEMTEKSMQWLDELPGNWTASVVLGLGKKNRQALIEASQSMHHKFQIVSNTSVISKYMASADFAITSAGRTVYELGSLGVPCVTVASGPREMTHEFAIRSPGTAFLGLATQVERKEFQQVCRQLIEAPLLRRKLHEGMLSCDFRSGIQNVIAIINEIAREGNR